MLFPKDKLYEDEKSNDILQTLGTRPRNFGEFPLADI